MFVDREIVESQTPPPTPNDILVQNQQIDQEIIKQGESIYSIMIYTNHLLYKLPYKYKRMLKQLHKYAMN